MENFEEIKKLWGETKCADKSAKSVTSEYIDYVISKRIKKVKNNFREYFWASFFYQNLVYGCLAFLIVRFFNRTDIEYSNDDIYLNIKNSFSHMSEFFRLKKRFDWVIVPLNCVLIVVINFILFVPNGFMANIAAGILLLLVWLVIFLVAIRIENKKKFVEPLQQMELILEDFKVSA